VTYIEQERRRDRPRGRADAAGERSRGGKIGNDQYLRALVGGADQTDARLVAGMSEIQFVPLAAVVGPRRDRVLGIVQSVESLTASDIELLASRLPAVHPHTLGSRSAFACLNGTDFEVAAQAAFGRIAASLTRLAVSTSDDLWAFWDGCIGEVVLIEPRWSLVEYWAQAAAQSALVGSGSAEARWRRAFLDALGQRPE
jgi:hypothetical protein